MELLHRIRLLTGRASLERLAERYARKRLAPRFGVRKLGEPVRSTRDRRVYFVALGDGRAVVKFVSAKKTSLAENATLAHRLFERAGAPVAPLLLADVGPAARRAHGLNCLIHRFIEGERFDPVRHRPLAPEVARRLARVHADHDETFGRHSEPRTGDYWEEFFLPTLAFRLKRLAARHGPEAPRRLEGLRRFLESWRDPRLGEGGYSLLHGDLLARNVLVSDDDEPAPTFIDLDRSLRGPCGLELAQAVTQFAFGADELTGPIAPGDFWQTRGGQIDGFLEAYFAEAPEDFREDWTRNRDAYLAWALLTGAGKATAEGSLALEGAFSPED